MRRFLSCFAFATLCFLNTWAELAQDDFAYYARHSPLLFTIPTVLVFETAITGALWFAWPRLGSRGFLLLCGLPAGITAVALLRLAPFDLTGMVRTRWFWPAALAVLVPLAITMFRHPKRFAETVQGWLLYSWPLLGLILFQAFHVVLAYPASAYADRPLAKPLGGIPRVRVVWFVFDELSEAMAFDHRPAGVELPELDRLRAESVHVLTARAPAERTMESLPALLTGRMVTQADPHGPSSLRINGNAEWSSIENVFDRARGIGVDSAMVGWFHPYGRLLHRSLTACSWSAGWMLSGVEEPHDVPSSAMQAMAFRATAQRNVFPLLGHWLGDSVRELQREQTLARFQYLLGDSERFAADPARGLVFLHLPVPHPPTVYDRKARRFATEHSNSYLDGLVLADWTLGRIRRAVDRAGLSGNTAIIVSSDHGWRSLWSTGSDWKAEESEAMRGVDTSIVPFLVKLAGSARGVMHTRGWNTIHTGDLAIEILAGRASTADHVLAFLGRK